MINQFALPVQDIESSARCLVRQLGKDALFHASEQANRCYSEGDRYSGQYWTHVAWVVNKAFNIH